MKSLRNCAPTASPRTLISFRTRSNLPLDQQIAKSRLLTAHRSLLTPTGIWKCKPSDTITACPILTVRWAYPNYSEPKKDCKDARKSPPAITKHLRIFHKSQIAILSQKTVSSQQ